MGNTGGGTMGLRQFDREGCQHLGYHVAPAHFEEVTDPPLRKIDVWSLQMLQHCVETRQGSK